MIERVQIGDSLDKKQYFLTRVLKCPEDTNPERWEIIKEKIIKGELQFHDLTSAEQRLIRDAGLLEYGSRNKH